MGNAESTQSANESAQSTTTTTARTTSGTAAAMTDEPRWNEIEHENLVLEQVPREVTVVALEPQPTVMAEEESEQSLEEFKEQLASRRLARQTALQDMREEINKLRMQLASEQQENRRLRGEEQGATANVEAESVSREEPSTEAEVDGDDDNPTSRSRHANIELANAQLALQLANADNLSLRSEVEVVQRQVGTLKEVICCCKQMLKVKEEQCAQLKQKLTEIEESFSEREMKIMSNNLRQEYERQLVNIRQLRQLYEERQRVAAAEYENLQRLISIKKDELVAEQEKTNSLEERNQLLNTELEKANAELAKLREECGEHKYEKRVLKEQVGAVNLLFSQLLLGNGRNNLDIDRLTEMLEENRDLLNEMMQAEGNCSDGASLPKLLFELVEQANKSEPKDVDKSRSATPEPLPVAGDDTTDGAGGVKSAELKGKRRKRNSGGSVGAASLKCHEPEIMGKVATAQEIIGNLPKVWKVLMELLSHHKIERVQFVEEMPAAVVEPSRSDVPAKTTTAGRGGGRGVVEEATAGTVPKAAELSVSKTYIKLKDLIMEKKSLVKETNRLKTLNCHLDHRLNEQENRLSVVSLELTKTWHLVGKMQRQHRNLHTQEQILRYQLQQKRRLLHELKDELEYCRRKWTLVRAKHEESQELCNDWRREFARRKLEDANHSAESGYSDSGPQSDEDTAAGAVATGETNEEEASTTSHYRRKHLRDQFEHTRKIKRMQSTSPGRQAGAAGGSADEETEEIVLRWNSAPPTCGWREVYDEPEDDVQDDAPSTSRGYTSHISRSRQRGNFQAAALSTATDSDAGTASRIQKLEEQCKSLIKQVLETSGNRERLEVQLCRFQDEIAPAQHAVPLDELINRKRLDRMTRASSAPASGSLTPREEEYTRKRSERLERLEEESRQLLSRIRRTTDRGHYLKKSLDRIRRAPSREGSFESNTEEEPKVETKEEQAAVEETTPKPSPLTAEEEAYTSRRAARLQRLEEESQQLLSQLSRNTERGEGLANRLDTLHEEAQVHETAPSAAGISLTVEQRLEDIERVSANRAERLRRLEEQGNQLIARLSNTSERGTAMINRIAQREANRRQEAELLEQALPSEEATNSVDNNIASSSIVGEDEDANGAACCVTVTTTSSKVAVRQSTGAIPKTTKSNKPMTQLCAALRQEDASKKRATSELEKVMDLPQSESAGESLEDMVQRLRSIPYPAEEQKDEQPQVEQQNNEETEQGLEQPADGRNE